MFKFQLRRAEIERLTSPDQLDTAMRVTSPTGWVALLALGCLILAAVAWSVSGKLTERVDGFGILLRGEGIRAIQAPAAGRVAAIEVGAGEVIAQGQVVARLKLTELEADIQTTKARIEELVARQQEQDARVSPLKQSFGKQLEILQEQLRLKKDLEKRGLADRQDVLTIEGDIARIRTQILQAEIGEGNTEGSINEERRKLERLQGSLEENSVILSPSAGKVAAVLVAKDQLIDAGNQIVSLEGTREEPFQVLLYVSLTDGKKVRPGMEVRISPTTYAPEDFGYILGVVDSVSSLPVSAEEVSTTLNTDSLAREFAKNSPFEVRARPLLDAAGRFRWTSAKGPSLEIESNTPCSAQVITGERPPLTYVIPRVKKTLGLG